MDIRFGPNDELFFHKKDDNCYVTDGSQQVFFTGKESKFLELLTTEARLFSNTEIANFVSINKVAIKVWVSKIRQKLNVIHEQELLFGGYKGYGLLFPKARYKKVTYAGIDYYPGLCRLSCGDATAELQMLAADFLTLLLDKPGEIIKKGIFYTKSLEREHAADPKIVDVIMCHVRDHLDAVCEGASGHLHTKWGVGYGLFPNRVPRDFTPKRRTPSGIGRKLAERHERAKQSLSTKRREARTGRK